MIEMTICLPLFRAKYIAWLALESLCRQKNIDFKWELIICEEIFDEEFGEEQINTYKERLKNVGCTNLVYIPLSKWIPLSEKICLMIKNASESSLYYGDLGADMYTPSLRIKSQRDILKNNPDIDWCAIGKTIFYEIKTEKLFILDAEFSVNDASSRASRMSIMRHFNICNKKIGIDGTIFKFIKNFAKSKGKKFTTYLDNSDELWMESLNVHGLNNLSVGGERELYFSGKRKEERIKVCNVDINKIFPLEILKKLRKSKKFLPNHNRDKI